MEENNKNNNGILLKSNLEEFIKNLESLRMSLHLNMQIILAYHKANQKKLSDFIDKKGKNRIKKAFTIKTEDAHDFKILKKEADITKASLKILPRSALISMVAQFDAYISSLIKILFILQPEILNASEKQLTFAEISLLRDINEIKSYIIEKEVEGVLRENHRYHFEWLEGKLNITLRKDLDCWKNFIEITERRNLFAHCDGKVSSQYLAICKQSGVKLSDCEIKQELHVTPEYIDNSYSVLYEIAVKLTHVIWRKLKVNCLKDADFSLNDICLNLINEESYKLADVLLIFSTSFNKFSDNNSSNCFIVNKALSKKLNDNNKEAKKIISTKDWSDCSNDFKLAKSVILDEYENIFLLMKKIGKKSEFIEKSSYRNWPLFKQIRGNKKFKETFKQIYKEDLDLKQDRLDYDFKLTIKKKKLNKTKK